MRPTSRGWALTGLALLFYFFANQTQVGWLYVFAALAAGLWLATWLLPGLMLRRLSLTRRVNGSATWVDLELYVGDAVTVDLELANVGRLPALQVRGVETCPIAPAGDQIQPFFVPMVSPRAHVALRYETTCGRRGWFEFPGVPASTRAPFGFFSARRELAAGAQTGLLVFPEYRELERVVLFDRMPAPQNTFTRLGIGGEFVGVREYRPGDSRRHVHWRSTARAGVLIVKEFAEETQPGLTIALDLRAGSVIGSEEDNSLELAIKIAATLARYADRRGLPVTLASNSRRWPAPSGPLSWWGLMNYLARVQGEADEAESFAECLRGLRATAFVAAILTAPDRGAIMPLLEWHRSGLGVLAVVIDPEAFLPGGGEATGQAQEVVAALAAGGVSTRVIGAEPDWERMLSVEK